MKIPLIITYILCSLALSAQVQKNISLSTSTVKSAISGGDGAQYVLVSNTGISAYAPNGEPLLPVCFYRFTVPANKDLSSLTVTYTGAVQTTLTTKVYPGQQVSPDPAVPFVFTPPLASIYSSSAVYPAQRAFISNVSWYGINKIVTVGVYMCSYIPSQNKLTCYSGAQFSASFTAAASIPAMVKRPAIRWDEEIATVKQKVANPEKAAEYYTYNNNLATAPSSLKSGETSPEYVIICPDALCSAFDEFVLWKRRKGIITQVIKLSDVLSSQSGDEMSGINDDAGKLRNYLRKQYDKGLKYALLIGDPTNAPIRWINNYAGPGGADFYFAELNGNWDKNKNGIYGEASDDVYLDRQIQVGRLLATNQTEIKNWTRKLIIYEQLPGFNDHSYLARSLVIGAQDVKPTASKFAEKMPHSFTNELIQGSDNYVTGKYIMQKLNGTVNLWLTAAHGNTNSITISDLGHTICSTDYLTAEEGDGFDRLTDIGHPGIFMGASCNVVPYNQTKMNGNNGNYNLGQSYTLGKIGGVAFIGGTRNLHAYETGNMLQKYLNDLNKLQFREIGKAWENAADTLLKTTMQAGENNTMIPGGPSFDRQLYFNYFHAIIGCPEMEIWVGIPNEFSSARIVQSGQTYTVYSGGVDSAMITVMSKDGVSYYERYMLSVNEFSHSFTNAPTDALITITKTGYLPYMNDRFIQNTTISTQIVNCNLYPAIGTNVTSSKPSGPVKIKSGGSLILNTKGGTQINSQFEIEKGGTFIINVN